METENRENRRGNLLPWIAFAVAFLLTLLMSSGRIMAYAGQTPGKSTGEETVSAASEDSRRVFDRAGLFSETARGEMQQQIDSMQADMGMDVVLVTTGNAQGETAREYAENFYIQGNYGTGDNYDGVLFLIDMDNRELYLAPVGKMNRYLTDQRWNAILDAAYNEASKGDYEACANEFLSGVRQYYAAGIPSGQYNYDEDTGKVSAYRSVRWYEALLALVVSVFTALVPCKSVVSQYSMKKEREQADNYLMAYRADSHFQIASQADDLINKSVTHILLPRSNNNGLGGMGGGGGSFSGRSTTHNSAGRNFGGGGRKF